MSTKTPFDVIASARARLATAATWLHDPAADLAIDASGHDCLPNAAEAVQWDLYGAMVAAQSGDAALDAAIGFVAEAAELCPRVDGRLSLEVFGLVRDWNDDPAREHHDVLRVLSRAANIATKAEAATLTTRSP